MRKLVDGFRDRSARVIRNKGGNITDGRTTTVWERYVRKRMIEYRVNRSHPLLKGLTDTLKPEPRRKFVQILKLIEQEIPIDAVFTDASANPQKLNQAATDPDQFLEFLRATIPMLLANGASTDAVVVELRSTDPYASHWPLVERYLTERGVI